MSENEELDEIIKLGDSSDPTFDPSEINIRSGVWNLANYIVGAGVLALPYACAQAGLLLGMLLVAIVCFAVKQSFNLLLWSTDLSNEIGYEQLGQAVGGTKFAGFIKCFIILDSLGPLSAYMVVVGDSMQLFLERYVDNDGSVWASKTFIIALCVLLIVVPLSFVEKIEKLEVSSLLSLLPLAWLMVMQVISFAMNGVTDGIEMFGSNIFLALPVVVFAFSCQQVMPPIYKEMKVKGGGKPEINKVVNGALGLSALSYFWVGFLGYLQYGSESEGNIMANFPPGVWSDILWVSMSLSILFSYPVVVYPARISVDRLLFSGRPHSYCRFVVENLLIVAVAFMIGVAIPSFSTLLGLFGAITSTAIGYIFPPVFYLGLSPLPFKQDTRKWIALTLLVCGTTAGALSFVSVMMEYLGSFPGN